MPPARVVTADPPTAAGRHEGLAYALFAPAEPPRGSVVILHGAGSVKENHFDFARAARDHGFVALAYDARGHGASDGELGAGTIDDLHALASLLPEGAAVALRGSSMGGYLALVGAAAIGAAAVVAICPAAAEGLRRGLQAGGLGFRADVGALDAFLAEHDERTAVAALEAHLLLLHAEGDERVPVGHSRELYAVAERARSRRLIVTPGGHHRSVQHDPELQGEALRWLGRVLGA